MSRISELPRRDWRAQAAPFVARLTNLLKTPDGTQTLRPTQAAMLLELAANRGLFANGRVGIGKSLVCALAAKMVGAQRPLVLCPGGILKATHAHFGHIARHWQVPPNVQLLSYSAVSNMPRQGTSLGALFAGAGPDLLVCDEAHRLRNVRGSALARQINDWMVAHPECTFVAVTGSADVEGLCDYGHLLDWALRDKSPLPRTDTELRDWSEVIDQGDMAKAQWAAQDLGIPEDSDLDAIREAYRERLHSCPGVIIDDTPFDKVPLTVDVHVLPPDPKLEAHFIRLRTMWQRPDGLDLAGGDSGADGREPDRIEGSSIWAVARRMGRGLCYVLDPPAPEPWKLARRAYFAWVRAQLEGGRFMTEAVAREHAERYNVRPWVAWRDIKDEFQPQQKTLWLSDSCLRWVEDWGRRGSGVIWVDDIEFGAELSRRTGWPYYQGRGYTSDGRYLEDAPKGSTVIASRWANSTGRNLQFQWNRCLFVAPVSKSNDFEQAVGRFFREGIETWADHVHADILITCSEDAGALKNMIASARRTNRNIYSQLAARIEWPCVDLPTTGAGYGHIKTEARS